VFIFADLFGAGAGFGVGIFSVALTVVLYALKVFVGLLQAYIFTLLSAVFIGMAAEDHAHDEEEYYTEHIAEEVSA
jgi:F-type H+-transporting ATPase subunit a